MITKKKFEEMKGKTILAKIGGSGPAIKLVIEDVYSPYNYTAKRVDNGLIDFITSNNVMKIIDNTNDKAKLINSIDWKKEFCDLTEIEKNNFISLHGIYCLNNANYEFVKSIYETNQYLICEYGLKNLENYI